MLKVIEMLTKPVDSDIPVAQVVGRASPEIVRMLIKHMVSGIWVGNIAWWVLGNLWNCL